MDGLECSEIMLSGIKSRSWRFDAEYYSKTNLKLQLMIESIDGATIDSYGGTCDCSAFYPAITSYYSNDRNDIPFLRVNEIIDGLVTITDKTVFLPKRILDINSRTIAEAYPGDIIIAKGGNSLAKVGLVTDEFSEYATCRDVIILRTEKFNGVNPYYVWAFLHSKYGQAIMWRAASQTGQPHLTLPSVSNIHIPCSLGLLPQKCEDLYRISTHLKHKAQAVYASAEELLLSSIDYRPIRQTVNYAMKSFSESFGATGRLDAEYYQPKYDELFHLLSTLPTKRLKGVVNITKSIEPGSEYYGNEGVPFIRVSDVSKDGITAPSIRIPKATVPSIENLYPKKDTILFSKDGSVGIAYKVENDMEAVTSGALLHLTVKDTTKILPDYLTLLLNSDIVKLQAERDASGAIIQHWKPSDIGRVVVPVLPLKMQRKIAEKVEESFSLRRRSKQLLENAKHAVEMAIEQGEDKAMRWLQEQRGI